MKREPDTFHAGQILALRTVCSFLLAREMKRENNKMVEIPSAFTQSIADEIEKAGLSDSLPTQEIEAAASLEINLIFKSASSMSDFMKWRT